MKTLFLMGLMLLFVATGAMAEEAVEEAPLGADIVAVLLTYLPASWGGWVTLVVTVCAAIAACWPRPSDDANIFVRILYAVVNAVGFNAGKAQNADDAAAQVRKGRA